MRSSPSPLVLTIHESFSAFDEAEWNALERGDFVFADLRFLKALENGRCLGRRTGWFPKILAVRTAVANRDADAQGELVGALCLFDKSNSYGEYIFDWAWANAAEQNGISYYPKTVAAIPFTPATGSKFLLKSASAHALAAREMLLEGARASATDQSSLHFLFETPAETELLRERSYLIRHSFQYQWRNRGWKTFADFLGALRSKRRSEIRRERETVAKSGITIKRLTGSDLTSEHAEIMYAFYLSTISKMGGHAYLSREFFVQVFTKMSDSVLFVLAENTEGEPIAGAFNLFRGTSLFGRYWGCVDDYKQLHFEVCYYQAIDWALERGFELFEAGAQGEHKFNRGFTPHLTLSAHEIHEPRLREAIAEFLEHEKKSIDDLFAEYAESSPFQRN